MTGFSLNVLSKKSKRFAVAVALIGLGAFASVSRADFVGVVDLIQADGSYSSGLGGEFNATMYYGPSPSVTAIPQVAPAALPSAAGPLPAPYSAEVPYDSESPAVFQTFCIQEGAHDVTFSPGTYYAGTIGTSTVDSGGNTQTVSAITATLFTLFWNGILPGYDYTVGAGRAASAGELQDAIWDAQGDNSFAGAASDAGISGAEITAAMGFYTFAATYNTTNMLPNGLDDVEILGLYDTADEATAGGTAGLHQSQLVETGPIPIGGNLTPLPSAALGGSMLMAGLGLASLVSRRKSRI